MASSIPAIILFVIPEKTAQILPSVYSVVKDAVQTPVAAFADVNISKICSRQLANFHFKADAEKYMR